MGRTAEMVLGMLGGILGILGGLFAVFIGGLGAAFEATGASEIIGLGTAAVILGIIGIIGGAIVNRNTKLAGGLMLFSGVAGFIAISAAWIIGGILLIVGGALSFMRSLDGKVQYIVQSFDDRAIYASIVMHYGCQRRRRREN